MKKEDLEKLKSKIVKLSEKELKERDKYLQGLANGKLSGPLTNYQSIDKPWLKYYDLNLDSNFFNMTVYESLTKFNKEQEDALSVLKSLGFKGKDIEDILNKLPEVLSASEYVNEVLKRLGNK